MAAKLDAGTLVTVAIVISAFEAGILPFRVQRENEMRGKGEPSWFLWAEGLLISRHIRFLIPCLIAVIFLHDLKLPAAASAMAVVMVAGYVSAILVTTGSSSNVNYVIFDRVREGEREKPADAKPASATTMAAPGAAPPRV